MADEPQSATVVARRDSVSRYPALAVLVLLLAAAGLAFSQTTPAGTAKTKGGKQAAKEVSKEDLARQMLENTILGRRAQLATSDFFYLLLEPNAGRLKLMLKNALLQDYHVLGLEIGGPRVLWKSRPFPKDWQEKVWEKGNLDPARPSDRLEMVVEIGDTLGADSLSKSFGVPKTPEEKYPVPSRYHVRYEGGLSLEVRLPSTADSLGLHTSMQQKLGRWWSDVKDALEPSKGDRIRLRIVLDEADAKSLYRAMPPDTKLLVVP